MVIAIMNSKGGVGKTTTSVNLSAALAAAERRVLLVDLDSQASASSWCGVQPARLKPSIGSCLLNQYPILQAVRRTPVPRLDLITGSVELASTDLALRDRPGRETALRHVLSAVVGRYGYVILDCPPGLSLLTVNALCAADALIVPVAPRQLVTDQLPMLLAATEKARTRLGARHRLLGMLLVMVHRGDASEKDLCARLRARYRNRVFQTMIPASRQFELSTAAHEPVVSFSPRSSAAAAVRRLASEVLLRTRETHH